MQTQIYQQLSSSLQQQQFGNIHQQTQEQLGKSLQKGISITSIHKAPLPPKLSKPIKTSIEQNSEPFINNPYAKVDTQKDFQEYKYVDHRNSQYQEPINNIKQNFWEQNYQQNGIQSNYLGQYSQINSQIGSSNQITNPYVITSSNIQIFPITMERSNNVKGLIQSQSISTPIYQPEQIVSPISKMTLNNTYQPLEQNVEFQANKMPEMLQNQIKNQILPIKSEEQNQQEKLKRSNSEYLPKKDNNLNEFKQFQVYLNQVTIDPNDYLKIQGISNCNENKKENSQESELRMDLQYTNYIEGGGSPFTLNKNPQKPNFFKTYEQLQKQDANRAGFGIEAQKIQDIKEGNQKQFIDNKNILQPPTKTSVQCQKSKENNTVTILEIEDYGSCQNAIENKKIYQQQKQENLNLGAQQKLFYNTENLQKFESFGKLNTENEGTNQVDPLKNSSNDVQNYNTFANYNSNGYQDYNCNTQLPQGLNLLSSINSNITGNEQSPFCSSFIKQSDLIRRRINSTDDPQILFNQTNIQNLFSNPSSTKNAKNESNPINIIETHSINNAPNYNSQPYIYVQGQKQGQANSIQETNEEYSESIVLDQIKNFNQNRAYIKDTNTINKIKNELNRPALPKPLQIKEQALFKSKSTEIISQNTPQNIIQYDDKNYYLQKAEQILQQLGQNPSFSNNTNITISSQNIVNPNLYLTGEEKSSNFTNNFQIQGNQVNLLPIQQKVVNNINIQPSPVTTERRKNNINQIVQKCVERTQDLIEKLKSKSKKQQQQKLKNILSQTQEKPQITEKSKKHEEIRQSRQKVDELVNEALYRSRQVVQRHFQTKNQNNSPQGQVYDQKICSNELNDLGNYNTNYQDQNVQYDYDLNSAQSKDNNTFGYSSNQNKETLSPNINLQFQQNQLIDPYQQTEFQIRMTPVGSDQKSQNKNYNNDANSCSKENNSISFDIQAGNSGKSNQLISQENLSPFKQNFQAFDSQNKQYNSGSQNQHENQLEKENQCQNYIFEGVLDADGRKQGYGILRNTQNQTIVYEGEWVNDHYDGQGILYNQFPESLLNPFSYNDFSKINNYWKVYEGEFKLGLKNGSGTLIFTNEEKYSGKFVNNEVHGEGVFYSNNSKQQPIVGQWVNNILIKLL